MTMSSTPNVNRINDYLLGGGHNVAADRHAAEQLLKVFPSYPRWARLNRWFLQLVARRWAAEGRQYILDLSPHLPTDDEFRAAAPDAHVCRINEHMASSADPDADPSVGLPGTAMQIDVSDPAAFLVAADQYFGGERRVAINCIACAYFIDDTSLARLMQALHDWAAPGSVLALSFIYGEPVTAKNQEAADLFKRYGAEIFSRDVATIERIIAPWQVRELKSLAAWLDLEHLISEADREGANIEMFGMLLERAGEPPMKA